VRYTVISVDDHVVEPPHLFEEYMSPRLRELGPQVVEHPNGAEVWEFDGETFYVIERNWGHIPHDELRAMCCENAARLYRHPLPEVVLPQ
jgi:hypothetical protein